MAKKNETINQTSNKTFTSKITYFTCLLGTLVGGSSSPLLSELELSFERKYSKMAQNLTLTNFPAKTHYIYLVDARLSFSQLSVFGQQGILLRIYNLLMSAV